jgi:DNA (cytosine-5)-methyltransferase 1
MNTKYSLVSLFAGVSGSSIGFHNTYRVDERLVIDCDDYVEKSFKLNFADVPFLKKALGPELSSDEILEHANLKREELAILFASPPCQGFSTAKGNRFLDDERNDLFLETIRYIDEIRPMVFIIENVTGLYKGKMVFKFNQIIRRIEQTGYSYRYMVLNAANFGVPQLRERIFFVGVRNDLSQNVIQPQFPTPTIIDPQILAIRNFTDKIDFFSSGQFANEIFSSEEVCRTITATASLVFYKDGEKRKPTIAEIKRLCSFPEDYKLWSREDGINSQNGLEYNYNQKYKALGNSVPPKLMEAVARTVITEILDKAK